MSADMKIMEATLTLNSFIANMTETLRSCYVRDDETPSPTVERYLEQLGEIMQVVKSVVLVQIQADAYTQRYGKSADGS